ncbi:MAG: hypothetical protein KUG78_15230 [Kangiellaceae bacterium]|nr:hypothetical protein [Kangiellaceae bacterium]
MCFSLPLLARKQPVFCDIRSINKEQIDESWKEYEKELVSDGMYKWAGVLTKNACLGQGKCSKANLKNSLRWVNALHSKHKKSLKNSSSFGHSEKLMQQFIPMK